MRRHCFSAKQKALKMAQFFYCLDLDSAQPLCYTLAFAARTSLFASNRAVVQNLITVLFSVTVNEHRTKFSALWKAMSGWSVPGSTSGGSLTLSKASPEFPLTNYSELAAAMVSPTCDSRDRRRRVPSTLGPSEGDRFRCPHRFRGPSPLWLFSSVNRLCLNFLPKLSLFPEGDDCADDPDDHESANVFGDTLEGLR